MRLVLQRVKNAQVILNDTIYSSIDIGILLLVGIESDDEKLNFDYYANKILNLRIFNDSNGKMNDSLLDINGSILVVSQFTLLANTKNGNRPSFMNAADPQLAKKLYKKLIKKLKNYEINVKEGRFGAHMFVDFINDGPVTIIMDSKNESKN
tara:strand:+ start:52 stop:507 length:456 start_codon:yes stop_codon:yes gene_type:complete